VLSHVFCVLCFVFCPVCVCVCLSVCVCLCLCLCLCLCMHFSFFSACCFIILLRRVHGVTSRQLPVVLDRLELYFENN